MTEVEIKGWGNSLGLIVPTNDVKKFKLRKGDKVKIKIIKKMKLDGFGMFKGAKPFEREEEEREGFW